MRIFGTSTNPLPSVVGILSLFFLLSSPSYNASHFRQTRDSSWRVPWPVRQLQFFLDGTHFILYQFEFSHACTYKESQFKHGGHRWWRRRWFSSNFHCHCRTILLSARATSTDHNLRAAKWIQLGSGNYFVTTRYGAFYAKVLCTCFCGTGSAYVCSCILSLL